LSIGAGFLALGIVVITALILFPDISETSTGVFVGLINTLVQLVWPQPLWTLAFLVIESLLLLLGSLAGSATFLHPPDSYKERVE